MSDKEELEFAREDDQYEDVAKTVAELDSTVLYYASWPKSTCMSHLHQWFPHDIVAEYECAAEDDDGIEYWNHFAHGSGPVDVAALVKDFRLYMLSADVGVEYLVNLLMQPYQTYAGMSNRIQYLFNKLVEAGLESYKP